MQCGTISAAMKKVKVKPQSVAVRDRVLPVCSHGECASNCVWDFDTCWEHMSGQERDELRRRLTEILRSTQQLKGLVLTGVDLRDLDFRGADLSHAFLNGCNLAGCSLVDADLNSAFLGGADMRGCDLSRIEADGAVFSGANLENVKLLGYSLTMGRTPVNLDRECFGQSGLFKRPHIDESEPYFSEVTYRSLKAYFITRGDYEAASWAAFSEKLMQRKGLWAAHRYSEWLVSTLFGGLCGYGELPLRVVIASVVIVLAFASVLWLGNCLSHAGPTPERCGFWEALYFSVSLFSGVSFGDFVPRATWLARFLAASESFSGVFIFGLFIFTVTKRHVAR